MSGSLVVCWKGAGRDATVTATIGDPPSVVVMHRSVCDVAATVIVTAR